MKNSFFALALVGALALAFPLAVSATPTIGGTGLAANAENKPVSTFEFAFTITSLATDVVTEDPSLRFELQRDGTNLNYSCTLDMATDGLNSSATTASISIQPWNPTVDSVIKECDFPVHDDTGKGYIPEGTYTVYYDSKTAADPGGASVSLSSGVRILHNDIRCEGGATKSQATNYCAGKYTSDDTDNNEDEYKSATIGLGVTAGVLLVAVVKMWMGSNAYTSTSSQ